MATSDHFGSWLRKVLPHWAKPLWANTFRGEGEAVREEVGKKGREREGEEQRGEVEQEKKEKKGHREARSGEPESMPRLAKEGRNGEVGEETTRSFAHLNCRNALSRGKILGGHQWQHTEVV